MKITKPDYFDKFRCLAGSCPDSCCKEWDIQVDAAAAERYRSLPGALGDDLRRVLTDCDGETVMEIISGTFTIDQLIDNIACQDTAAHACIMNEAIRLLCIDYGIALTEEQLQRMKANTKSQTAGPNQYNQFFGADSNGYIINN